MSVVIQDWVCELPWKHQTVLLMALRGCDRQPKESDAKYCVRCLRGAVVKPIGDAEKFLVDPATIPWCVEPFQMDLDAYPVHWLVHFIHAIGVIGYKHPDETIRRKWLEAYVALVKALHFHPETESEMDERLG